MLLLGACAGPSVEDSGTPMLRRTPDAGEQCDDDGINCWPEERYCEAQPCTYSFPDTGGTCGGQPIRPSCYCARDERGAFRANCTGRCLLQADGGFALLCVTPNCGSVNCGTATRCVGYGRCE